ncbi:MAG TPA: alpha-L-fucosidase, partial [Bacteroidales bacterium]|nr:alpha-L-fucosidase [Bacteroidales bacterium]
PGECDVSIRPGWFYHKSQDNMVKSLDELKEIYYNSVGRNGVMLLNIPPDQRGLIHETDAERLMVFGNFVRKTFDDNLAADARASARYILSPVYHPEMMLDNDIQTFWAGMDGMKSLTAIIDLPDERIFDLVSVGENIAFGQRVKAFNVEAYIDEEWKMIAKGTTIGYKRIIKTEQIETRRIRLNITDARGNPLISSFGIFLETD